MGRLKRISLGTAILWLALAVPACAQPSALQLVPAPSNVVETVVTIEDATLGTEIHVRNAVTDTASGPLHLRPSALLVRRSDGSSVRADWKRTGDAGEPNVLQPGEEATFLLSANLPEAGVYETFIETQGTPAAASGRIRVVVTRTAETLPSEFLVDPRPVGQTWGGLGSIAALWTAPRRAEAILGLRNTTARKLDFLPPSVLAFAQRSAEADTAVATGPMPAVDSAACASPLPPGAACALKLSFSPTLLPGTYAIDVGVGGPSGGWSQRTEIVRVRATPLLAFLAIVIGAGAGWYISAWRSAGRRALDGLIETTRLRDRLQRLVAPAGDADVARLLARARERIDEVEVGLRRGADPASDLTAIAAHLGRLVDAIEISDGMAKLTQDGQDALRPRWKALVAALGDAGAAGSSLDGPLRSLAADVSAWPGLANHAAAARALATAGEALQSAGGPDLPKDAPVATLRKAAFDAMVVLDPDTPADTVAARDTKLAAQIASARVQAGGFAETAASTLADLAANLSKPPAGQAAGATKLARDAKALADRPLGDDPVEPRFEILTALWKTYSDILSHQAGHKNAVPAMIQETDTTAEPQQSVIPVLDAPVSVFLPGEGRSLAVVETARNRNELVTNLLVLMAIGLSGVVTLWVPDPTWGSLSNVIGAMLAGLAAHVAVGEAVVRR